MNNNIRQFLILLMWYYFLQKHLNLVITFSVNISEKLWNVFLYLWEENVKNLSNSDCMVDRGCLSKAARKPFLLNASVPFGFSCTTKYWYSQKISTSVWRELKHCRRALAGIDSLPVALKGEREVSTWKENNKWGRTWSDGGPQCHFIRLDLFKLQCWGLSGYDFDTQQKR